MFNSGITFVHWFRIPRTRLVLFSVLIICALFVTTAIPVRAMDEGRDLTSNDGDAVTPIKDGEMLPPLPIFAPQIGPIIKQSFSWDVDRWTTAFIPGDLGNLSPIDLPTDEEKWIRVDLSEQTVIAYEGDRPIRGFIVSSGLPATPTVTGTFRIRTKVRSQNMTGGNRAADNYYNLDNVQWVQYFYQDYSFHGTYWHNDFGTPHSHGCLNMTIMDAKWLFDWANPKWDGTSVWYNSPPDDPGTLVIVHD